MLFSLRYSSEPGQVMCYFDVAAAVQPMLIVVYGVLQEVEDVRAKWAASSAQLAQV